MMLPMMVPMMMMMIVDTVENGSYLEESLKVMSNRISLHEVVPFWH